MSLDAARRIAELVQEQVALMERLAEINRALSAEISATFPMSSGGHAAEKSATGRRRGGDDERQPGLPDLLATIAAERGTPLQLVDFVRLARESGYQTEAKDFPYMVFQALVKLVRRGVLVKGQPGYWSRAACQQANSVIVPPP